MQKTKFKKNGGPIIAKVSAGYAQTGSYELKLWEANKNEIIKRWEGDFQNPDNDEYQLPAPNEQNDKRRLQAIVVLAIVPPIKQYSAALTITQNGEKLNEISFSGKTDDPSIILNLYTSLEQDEEK